MHRSVITSVISLFFGFILLFSASSCGGGGGGESGTDGGSIRFRIEEDGGGALTTENRREFRSASPVAQLSGLPLFLAVPATSSFFDNCNSDIFSIKAFVYDESGAEIASAGPWPCSRRKGSVSDITNGRDRQIRVHAMTADGAVRYHGEKEGLEVLPGAVTDAGVIQLRPYETDGYIRMSDGAMIYYEMKGEGPPLILIHGGEQTSESWDYQFAELSESYTVIRYDIRHFGKSYVEGVDPFMGMDEVINTWEWSDTENRLTTDLVEIMEYMNLEKAHICGLSIGSSIAAQLAVFHPEMVDKIIYTSPWAYQNFPENEGQLDIIRGMTDKTLIILGADDTWMAPEYVEEMKMEGYTPTTVVIEDATHNCNEEQPEIYTDHVLAWLRDEIVSFPDPNFEAAVRSSLEKPEGAILASELKTITSLIVPGEDIENIDGIQYCTNLRELDLRSNDVQNIAPLAELPLLEILLLNENPVSDIRVLSNLTTLIELNLSKTDVTDLSPISNLQNLETLYLWGMGISDISAVENLNRLSFISFGNNVISDIRPLSNLVNLQTIWLDENQIADILPLLANNGIDEGDEINLRGNPLNQEACTIIIPQLFHERGVLIDSDTCEAMPTEAWEWMNPLPHGNSFEDIWGSSENDIFAVGRTNTVYHFNGFDWEEMNLPDPSARILAVWGASSNNVFFVGSPGTIYYYDGNNWSEMQSNTSNWLTGIWGSSANDVFAVGDYGTILHYDGENWSEMTSPTNNSISDVWGSSKNNVFAVSRYHDDGWKGNIYHYDGISWSEMLSVDTNNLKSIWGNSGSDVFVSGSGTETGIILHYDGNKWEEIYYQEQSYPEAMCGRSGSDVYAVGAWGGMFHYNGLVWEEMTRKTTNSLNGIWCGENTVYAVGVGGTILRYDGSSWSTVFPKQNVTLEEDLNNIWGVAENDVFAVGSDGTIVHHDGFSWTEMAKIDRDIAYFLLDIWGTSGENVYAVGSSGGIVHYNGSSWTQMESGISDVIIDGRYISLQSLWGNSPDNIFAVGGDGTILYFNGSNWSNMMSGTTNDLSGVWGSSSDNVFAVSYDGEILHYNGTEWSIMENPNNTESLYSIWGSSEKNIFAVGNGILHYDGISWTMMESGFFKDVWGSSENNVYAVGNGGKIFHYDGTFWSKSETDISISNHFEGVWVSPNGEVFAVGDYGTILHKK